jgi:hypothetical protein
MSNSTDEDTINLYVALLAFAIDHGDHPVR